MLMFLRDFRRSYRAYSYSELILITDLCSFRAPLGVTELMLIQRYLYTYWYLYLSQISRRSLQNLYLYYGVYTCSEVPIGTIEITERILVLRNLYLRYRVNSCISDTEVPVGTTEHFVGTKVPVGTTKQIHYTDVPVGPTRLILILVFQILYLSYIAYTYLTDLILALRNMYLSYRSYTYFTDTGVPVGTTELILILSIREYP